MHVAEQSQLQHPVDFAVPVTASTLSFPAQPLMIGAGHMHVAEQSQLQHPVDFAVPVTASSRFSPAWSYSSSTDQRRLHAGA